MTEPKKIVWAVDILGDEEARTKALNFIKALQAKVMKIEVDPVYLLSSAPVKGTPASIPQWEEAYRALAEKRFQELSRVNGLEALKAGTIISETDSSTRKAANRIVQYATDHKADAILVTTHARRGLDRFFLGSFAETLLLQSPLPVIAINPKADRTTSISSILFPSDVSQASRRGFEEAVDLAIHLGAKLTLFYKEPPIMISPYESMPIVTYDFLEDEAKARKAAADAWVDWAKDRGCQISLEMDSIPGNVANAITQYAFKNGIDLISMAGQSGPVSSVLLGSVSREVVRTAPCAVWIRHR
jgi:nucleotide-binding universal stress UspA family protein